MKGWSKGFWFDPTVRSLSVRNRCVIEAFGGVFMLSRCFLDFSVDVGAFIIGLSQISSFFSYCVGAVVAEWLSSWLAEQEDRGSIPGLAT